MLKFAEVWLGQTQGEPRHTMNWSAHGMTLDYKMKGRRAPLTSYHIPDFRKKMQWSRSTYRFCTLLMKKWSSYRYLPISVTGQKLTQKVVTDSDCFAIFMLTLRRRCLNREVTNSMNISYCVICLNQLRQDMSYRLSSCDQAGMADHTLEGGPSTLGPPGDRLIF
jgi:hypothetical protein